MPTRSDPVGSAGSPRSSAAADAIPFSCPFCGQETLVDRQYAGQSGPCATCGKDITVPYVPARPAAAGNDVVVGIAKRSSFSIPTIIALVLGGLLAAILAVTMLITLIIPAAGSVADIAYRHQCEVNLRRIGEALRAYELQNGSLPPAYVADANGKPMHSWRVLLLPYLDEHGLHSQYDFAQPWDSPHNQALATKMPSVYGCPADPDSASLGETNYMVIRGKDTLFPNADSTQRQLMSDPPDLTIMVVEVPAFGASWLKPQDLEFDKTQFLLNEGYSEDMGSYHPDGAHALMADDTVRFLSTVVPPDYLKSMATHSGGEAVPPEVLDY